MSLILKKEQRTKLLHDAQQILLRTDATTEERANAHRMVTDAALLQDDIKALETIAAEQRAVVTPPREQPGGKQMDRNDLEKRAFKNYITGRLTADDHQYLLANEKRDLTTAGTTSGGGVLVPVGYDSVLHTATKAVGEILGSVRTWNTDSGEGIRVSLHDPTSLRFSIVNEMSTVGETDPTLSGFNSYVDTLGFSTKVSNQILQDSAFSVENFLTNDIVTAWVATASESIMKGNGSNFQSLIAGSSVGYTMPNGGTSALSYTSLLAFYSSLNPSYRKGAAFWTNHKTWATLLGISDSQGRPILTADFQGAPFQSLFGLPIRLSEALDDLGASKVPMILGDASLSYTYRQAGPMVVRRATELYLAQNATGYFAYQRAGGYVTSQASSPSMVKLVMAAS